MRGLDEWLDEFTQTCIDVAWGNWRLLVGLGLGLGLGLGFGLGLSLGLVRSGLMFNES